MCSSVLFGNDCACVVKITLFYYMNNSEQPDWWIVWRPFRLIAVIPPKLSGSFLSIGLFLLATCSVKVMGDFMPCDLQSASIQLLNDGNIKPVNEIWSVPLLDCYVANESNTTPCNYVTKTLMFRRSFRMNPFWFLIALMNKSSVLSRPSSVLEQGIWIESLNIWTNQQVGRVKTYGWKSPVWNRWAVKQCLLNKASKSDA